MNPNQIKALDKHSTELFGALGTVIEPFFNHLQRHEWQLITQAEKEVIEVNKTSAEKLFKIFELIKLKDRGWEAIISYLRSNKYGTLADNLEKSAKENGSLTCETAVCGSNQDFPEVFKQRLKEFYKSEHSRVPTMFDHHKHVNDVWVPLRIDEKTGNPKQSDTFDHIELQRRLSHPESPHVAIVKGDPGIGKTTLVKKITYDWATGKCNDFSLILAVPLRYVGSTRDFLELAAQYFTHRLHLAESSTTDLVRWLSGLGRKLLICLDGLDEYASFAQSPLAGLFAEKFRKATAATTTSEAPLFSYQLLITSRPYACEINNPSFFALRFEISSLDESHLADFIRLYCETDEGKAKVRKYVKKNKKLVIAVPLILMFVCYLADMNEEIPTNLTLLYEKLVYNMLTREIVANKIADEINADSWKYSKVVESTARLAFDGCKKKKFEFSESVQNYFDVTQESFISGFLLYNFNFGKQELTVEFPHRSIQEFFAAIHCYQLILAADNTERISVMNLALYDISQFGRFFFGICSDEKRFEKMLEWLNPTFIFILGTSNFTVDPSQLFFSSSVSLSDCSEAEAKLLGQRLAASVDQLEKKIRTERNSKINIINRLTVSSLNAPFQDGLNLIFLHKGKYSWSLSHVDNPKWSRLTFVQGDLSANLRKKFDKIQVLMLVWDIREPTGMISFLGRLPPVSTLIINYYDLLRHGMENGSEVNFDIHYETTSATIQLRHFTLGFNKYEIPSLKDLFSDQLEIDALIIGETRKTGYNEAISWLTVTVRQSLKPKKLMKILIQLAVEVAAESLETKRKQKKCGLM